MEMIVFLRDPVLMDQSASERSRFSAGGDAQLKCEIDAFILYADEVRRRENTARPSRPPFDLRVCKMNQNV